MAPGSLDHTRRAITLNRTAIDLARLPDPRT